MPDDDPKPFPILDGTPDEGHEPIRFTQSPLCDILRHLSCKLMRAAWVLHAVHRARPTVHAISVPESIVGALAHLLDSAAHLQRAAHSLDGMPPEVTIVALPDAYAFDVTKDIFSTEFERQFWPPELEEDEEDTR